MIVYVFTNDFYFIVLQGQPFYLESDKLKYVSLKLINMKKLLLIIMSVMAFAGMSVAQDIYSAGYYTSSNQKAAVYKNGTKLYEYGSASNFSYDSPDVACYNGDVFWITNAFNSSGICKRAMVRKNSSTFLDEGADNEYFMKALAIDHDGWVVAVGGKQNGSVFRAARWSCGPYGSTSAPVSYMGNTSYDSWALGCLWYNNYVYSCGYQYTSSSAYRGVIWKGSDVFKNFDSNIKLYDIALLNGYLYTVGSVVESGATKLKVWKTSVTDASTSVVYTLSESMSTNFVNSRFKIYIESGDIYVNGMNGTTEKIWKNGDVLYTDTGAYYLNAVFANTNGVYYAGRTSSNANGTIWKDGSVLYTPSNCDGIQAMYIDEPECQNGDVRPLPFTDGFENGETNWPCWTTIDVDNNNNIETQSYWTRRGRHGTTPCTGDYCARHGANTSQTQEGWLITPRLFLQPGRDNTTLTFKSWVGQNFTLRVYVSTNSDPTATSSYESVYQEQQTSHVWTAVNVDLSDYQGQAVYIGFKYVGQVNTTWLIDDVSVTESWTPYSTPYDVPYTFNFNGWNIHSTYWYIVDKDMSGGGNHWKYNQASQCAYHPWGPQNVPQYGCLVSPNINLVAGHDYVLKFRHKSSSSGSNMSNKIYYKLDGTGTPNPNNYTSLLWNDSNFPSDWTEVEIPLSSYAGHTISFSFEYRGTWAHAWYLDDFRVEEAIAQYTITANANNNDWGTVTGGGDYNAGATCTLTATPASGYQFESWKKNGTVVSTNANYSFTVTENATYTAYFAEVPVTYYEITTNVSPVGAGTVTGGGTFPQGSSITLTATANPGYSFSQWQDGNTDNPRTITVTQNATYTATFTQNNYTINVYASPADGGTVTGGGDYHYGDVVTLTATPNANFDFQGWDDGIIDNPRTITVTGNATYTAIFSEQGAVYYAITANVDPEGAGIVTGDGTYEAGTEITLTATANPGYTFDHWNDGSTQNPRTITVTTSMNFTAYFNHNTYIITVVANPSNAGTVSGGGPFYYGDYAMLMATPYSGYDFVGWSDGSSENPHQVLVTGNATYTATFSQGGATYYTVSTYVSPTDAGSVTGAGTYPAGTTITLTATANEGYNFDRWNDGNTQNPRTITVNNNMSFTAYFTAGQYTITVNANPAEGGTVTGGGTFAYGTTTTLRAIPNSGYQFLQWSDGTLRNPRTVTVTGNATYTALFSNGSGEMFTLKVEPNLPLLGQTSGSGTYPAGASVEISAYPNTYAHFVKWDDGNTQNPRTVIVNRDMTFIAEFSQAQEYTIEVVSSDPNRGQAFGGGTFMEGTVIQISAMAYEGFVFEKWDDGNTQNPRSITVTGNATYKAVFVENTVVTHTLQLICNTSEGTVSGGGVYVHGTTAMIGAFPNEQYTFEKWSDENTQNPRQIVVDRDITLVAFFKGTGVDENETAILLIYPNPAKESIRIQGIEANSELRIFNALGELVKVVNAGPDDEISVKDLAEGLYLVRCGNVTMRFVKTL